jgi:uncharacterized protein (TIGR02996 family)
MTDLQALYAGICALPDEDTPRLALADFLDEEGGKANAFRADFVRTHVRLAREEPYSEPWRELNERWAKLYDAAMKLAKKHKLPWVAHLKGRVHGWFFERGLVGELRLFSKRFVTEGESYFEQDPIRGVRFLSLRSSSGTVGPATLFKCPHLTRLAKLDLDGSVLKDTDLAKLGAAPRLPGLRALGLGGGQRFTAAALPKLLKVLPALSELNFRANERFGDKHLTELAKCKELARVTTLDLSGANVGPSGLKALASSKHAAALTVLRLGEVGQYDPFSDEYITRPGDPGEGLELAEVVAASKSFGKLQELNLRYRAVGDDGVKLLTKAAKALPALRRIDLGGCNLTLAGVEALAQSELGRRLLYVNLTYSPDLRRHRKKLGAMFPAAHVQEPL